MRALSLVAADVRRLKPWGIDFEPPYVGGHTLSTAAPWI